MTGTRNFKMWLTICSLMLVLVSPAAADTHYVNPGDSIQAAINAAVSGDQIEVAPGSYNEAINFHGKAIRLYSVVPEAATIDASGLNSSVVTCNSGEGANTRLEGFIVTGGNSIVTQVGGGMHNDHSSPTVTNCIFRNNVATGTWAMSGVGGGMYNYESSPTVTNCTFRDNEAKQGEPPSGLTEVLHPPQGGGMYNYVSSPTVTDCTFVGNKAGRRLYGEGGGMYNLSSSPKVTNCKFTDNTAPLDGGGGMANYNSSPTVTDCDFSGSVAGMLNERYSSPTVTNCTFSGGHWGMINESWTRSTMTGCAFSSSSWTGMLNRIFSSSTVTDCTFKGIGYAGMENKSCNPTVTNCTFIGNTRYGIENIFSGPEITNCTFTGNWIGIESTICGPKITNCIVWGNTGQINETAGWTSVNYCDVEGGWYYSGTGNIDQDPKFADSDGRLSWNSPCIDAGNNSAISGVATDLDGNRRIVNGDHKDSAVVDMGAYEAYEGLVTIHVPGDCATIQSAIDVATSYYSQIEVAPGTYCEAIDFKGKAIQLYSSGGPQVTTINGGGAFHVVRCVSAGDGTTLEGFTITGGNANGSSPDDRGGGMYNENSSPTVTKCTFSGNRATAYGGGMSNWRSTPVLSACNFQGNLAAQGGGIHNDSSLLRATDCRFQSNTAALKGGAMGNSQSQAILANCSFSTNRATQFGGGGMYNYDQSQASLTNCAFTGNAATNAGGGGMSNDQSQATLINCTFTGNSAAAGGGGMSNDQSQATTLINCNFTGNWATAGGAMYNINSNPAVTNCILWANTANTGPQIYISGGTAAVTYSDVQGGWSGMGNKNANPLFADGAGRLSRGSPCIDAGNNAAVSGVATDLDGKPRKTDGDLNGSAVVDMGAYEYVSVDADADGIKDGVDTAPLVYSNDFADGSTTGTIIDRADQLLVIADAPAPHGVLIEAGTSGGPSPAQVSVCGGGVLTLGAGDAVVVTCGSIEITVVHGIVEIVFTATDGTQVQTTLNAGNAIAFDPETCTFTAPASNVYDVVVTVNGVEIVLAPGESKTLAQVVGIDIYPNRTPNPVFVSRYYTIYVGVMGSGELDVTNLNSATVKFGRTGTEASPVRAPMIRDLNGDGQADALYGFWTFDCGFQLGDTQGWLKGSTTSGTLVEGSDSVLVSP